MVDITPGERDMLNWISEHPGEAYPSINVETLLTMYRLVAKGMFAVSVRGREALIKHAWDELPVEPKPECPGSGFGCTCTNGIGCVTTPFDEW